MFRRIVGIVASILALSLLATGPATAAPDAPPTLTVADYSAYLADEAPDMLAEFEALTPAEQEQYLDLLTNPSLYTEDAENLEGVDVVGVTTELTRSPGVLAPLAVTRGIVSPLATTVDRSVWSTRWVKILGIKVIEYKTELGYRVTSGKVTKINNSKAYLVRNLNPLVKSGTTSKDAWVSARGASARLSATFNYDIGPLKGLSVQIMTLNASLTGYPNGTVGYSWSGS